MKSDWLKSVLIPSLLFLSIALLGILLLVIHVPHVSEEITKSVGHALVVAAILGGTVDFYVKQRLLREVSKDVAKYLIGYNLPIQVQDKIKDLMATKIVRRDLHLHYELSTIEGDAQNLKLTVEIRYLAENLCNQAQEFRQVFGIEKHLSATVLELRCDSPDEKARYHVDRDKLMQESVASKKKATPGVFETYGRTVRLQPKSKYPAQKYQFSCKYSHNVPKNYSDTFNFAGPTIGVVITADHPGDLEFIAPDSPTTNVKRWEYDDLFLKGEHTIVRWFTKSSL